MTRHLETDTLTNQDISSALEIGSYIADADRLICVQALIDEVEGNDDYVFYATLQINGAGSAYRFIPITTAAAASGVTAIGGQAILIPVRDGDVVKVYVTGLAGDDTTPDTTVRWFELAALKPTTADRTLDVSAGGEVELIDDALTSDKFDESTAFPLESADTGATQVARVGADGDTLETLSDQIDLAALEATLAVVAGYLDTEIAAILAAVDTEVAAILAQTGTDGVVVDSHTTAAKAEIQTEAEDALIAKNLDHFMKTAVADNDDMTTEVPDGTVLSNIMTKDGDTSDFVPSDESLQGIRDAMRITGLDIADGISGNTVTKKRGDHWTVEFTGDNVIGDITDFTKLWLTVKRKADDLDSEAIFMILLSDPADAGDGIQYLNGAAVETADKDQCGITVSDEGTGAATVEFEATVTDDFEEAYNLVYDWQALIDAKPTTKREGNWNITADVTRAVS